MAEFTLRKKPAKTLKVNIGEESFHIPLSGSLTPSEMLPLNTAKGTQEFIAKHLSPEVAEVLTIDDYNAITKAWIEASNKAAGKSTGE